MERSRGWRIVAVIAGLLVCSLVAPAVALGAADGSQSDRADVTESAQEFDADRVEFRITVDADGSAEWRFRYEQGLENDEERADFESFAEEFNTEETELYRNFQERANSLTESGSEATDREMAAEEFQRDARVEGLEDNLGVVEMSFRWVGLAESNDRVVLGDAFEGGLYIGQNERLVIRPAEGQEFSEIRPDDGELSGDTLADSSSVTWEGEKSFTDNRPRVVFVEEGTAAGGTPTNETPGETTPPGTNDPGWLLLVGVLLLILLLGSGAAIAYRTGLLPFGEAESRSTPTERGETVSDSAADTKTSAAPTGAEISEEELIPDEQRVVELLESNGGRMKQVDIVEATDWSKSKVSMLLSDMEEEGTISKLRVGRENIVSLSGHEPDAAGSPFDDE